LKRAKKPLPYINIGEANKGMARAIKEKEKAGKEKPARKGTKTKHGQPKSSARFLALARTQSFPSSLIFCMTIEGKEDLLLKTRSFLSFQISQVTRVMADRKPLGEEVVVFEAANQ
jgi:hypothetical protein